MSHNIRVLFVCLGNICRSPTAEGIFRALVRADGLEDVIYIDSTGTGDWNLGNPPHPETAALLERHQIPYDHMRATRHDAELINSFDYVVAMDGSNTADLRRMGVHEDKISLLTDYIPDRAGEDVPDPYYYGGFEAVFDIIETGVRSFYEHIKLDNTIGVSL